jgi:hypothetical protein
MLRHLLFVTVHIQFGLGHIGIDFLTSEQKRKNMLIRMDVDNPAPVENNEKNGKANGRDNSVNNNTKSNKFDPSSKFRRSAPTFIIFCVLPYMFQIILFGNLNNFSFMFVRNQIHNSVRIDELFNHVSVSFALEFLCFLYCMLTKMYATNDIYQLQRTLIWRHWPVKAPLAQVPMPHLWTK